MDYIVDDSDLCWQYLKLSHLIKSLKHSFHTRRMVSSLSMGTPPKTHITPHPPLTPSSPPTREFTNWSAVECPFHWKRTNASHFGLLSLRMHELFFENKGQVNLFLMQFLMKFPSDIRWRHRIQNPVSSSFSPPGHEWRLRTMEKLYKTFKSYASFTLQLFALWIGLRILHCGRGSWVQGEDKQTEREAAGVNPISTTDLRNQTKCLCILCFVFWHFIWS